MTEAPLDDIVAEQNRRIVRAGRGPLPELIEYINIAIMDIETCAKRYAQDRILPMTLHTLKRAREIIDDEGLK